jgi:hypothetical protein
MLFLKRPQNPSMRIGLLLPAALLATFVAYFRGLAGPMWYDDYSNLYALFNASPDDGARSLIDRYLLNFSGPTGRPVVMLTFILNALLTPVNLWAWKLTNLLIHLANGLLVFLLARTLLERFEGNGPSKNTLLGLLVASAWMLMPLHVSTVLYTVQRFTELSTFFTLLGLLCYSKGRFQVMGGYQAGWFWLLSSILVLWPLAIFSKETGLLLAFYVLVLESVIYAQAGSARRDRRWALATMLAIAVPAIAAAFLFILQGQLEAGYLLREYTPIQRLMTEARVLVEYARLTLFPDIGSMGFHHDDIKISKSLLNPPATLLSILTLSATVLIAVRLNRQAPLVMLGIGLFLVGHLLESTIIPLDLMYEHRQYFPSFGLWLAFVTGLSALPMNRRVLVATMTLLILLSGVMTWQRATAWADERTMLAQMLRAQPDSLRLNLILANRLAESGHFFEARQLLDRFDNPGIALNIAYLDCIEHGTLDSKQLASIHFPADGVSTFYVSGGIINLGRAGLNGRCRIDPEEYVGLIDRLLSGRVRGQITGIRLMRAHFLHRAGRLEDALAELEWRKRQQPSNPVPDIIAAEMLIETGHLDRAERHLSDAQSLTSEVNNSAQEMLEQAKSRLKTAHQSPKKLTPYDPMVHERVTVDSARGD